MGNVEDWEDLTQLAKEYLSYLPVGDSPLNRNQRQREIVNYVLPAVRPYLFKIAFDLKKSLIKIRNSTGGYSLLSLKHRGILAEDLVQIGSLELHERFHKYNPKFSFATFVYVYAGKSMHRVGNRDYMSIALPYVYISQFKKLIRNSSSIEEAISEMEADLIRKNPKIKNPSHVAKAICFAVLSYSNDRFGLVSRPKGTYGSLESRLDSGVENPCDISVRNDLIKQIFGSEFLTKKELDVLRKFYLEERTLIDIGREFNLSRERIRQIKLGAIRKLREDLGGSLLEN